MAAPTAVTGVVLPDTEAWWVRDPTGRDYPVWVALPAGYERDTHLRYPVLYVTDAPIRRSAPSPAIRTAGCSACTCC